MPNKYVAAGVFAFALASSVMAQSVNDYMIRAIGAGEASGVINDDTAKVWRQKTRSNEPVKVQVKTIKKFNQEGCSRLAVSISQAGVALTAGGTTTAVLPFEMNLCRDGSPPLEGVDMNEIKRKAQLQQQQMLLRQQQSGVPVPR